MTENIKQFSLIGAAIIDVLAGPVDSRVFETGSLPLTFSKISFGGDALNEAAVLAKLDAANRVSLVSKVGNDEAGAQVLSYLKGLGISTAHVVMEEGLQTGVNIVLVDENGERCFLTNPNGSLRKLTEEDIMKSIDLLSDYVCFASIFVSPHLAVPEMERIFSMIKKKPGRVLFADMTKAKNGETLKDISPLLKYVDYLIPNEAEIEKLTGIADVKENADLLLESGVKCVVVKRGKEGCLIKSKIGATEECVRIPAFPVKKVVDTTGAGDSFAAGFMYASAKGWSLEDCGRFACATASFAVESAGAADGIPCADRVMERFEVYRNREISTNEIL